MNNSKDNKKEDIDPDLASAIEEVSDDFSQKLNFNVDQDASDALEALLKENHKESESSKQEQSKIDQNLMNPFKDLQGPEGIQKLQNMFGSQEFMKANQQMMNLFANASKTMPTDGDPTSSMGMGGMPTGQMFSPEMLQAMLGGGPPIQPPQGELGKHPPPDANEANPFMQSYMDMQNQAMNQMPMFAEGMQSMLSNMGDVKNPEEFMMKFMGEFQGFMQNNESNPGVQNFMESLMQDMMNKETLYPHMKELQSQLPEWLEKNQSKISMEDLEKHNMQLDVLEKIISLFEKDYQPIDKWNQMDAEVFQKFQKENQQICKELKSKGRSEEEIKTEIDKRQLPKLDDKQIQERKKVADPVIQNLMKLLQEFQDAGQLPKEIVEKVSIKRMNQQMKMFQDVIQKDKVAKKPQM